ncbi:hypothetical protein GCM10022219_21480 [Microbacterium oryzae]|uniref:LppP/LprE family lipoprotein n=1 Tax=Microbacterium oryzae TaxID=743009 RepID=A0A6I6DRQ7_9MICO|nr:LppP/LprE family lipoprotein [Microbacterium oryzae]QGU27615.1 LppP/LprE family lipoprotein [Microbacterium oryzae]
MPERSKVLRGVVALAAVLSVVTGCAAETRPEASASSAPPSAAPSATPTAVPTPTTDPAAPATEPPAPDPSTAPVAPDPSTPETAPSAPSTPPPPSDPGACGTLTRDEAAAVAAQRLPPPLGDDYFTWDTTATAADPGYDPCAALSWIVFPLAGGTGSSPNAIALFHEGEYVGPATEEQYGFRPAVERLSDDSIRVTYPYLLDGDANADPQGQAVARFTWDAETQSVQMDGNPPPSGGGVTAAMNEVTETSGAPEIILAM